MSLPSLDRSPLALSVSGAPTTIETALEYWNARLAIYAMFLEAKYAGVKTKWFDARNFTADVRFLSPSSLPSLPALVSSQFGL
jgi:hypothetical protein